MNIFIIPSWYPSVDYPANGIMIYEQIRSICELYPEVNVGVSIWGRKEERYLLWARNHIKNITKVINADLSPYTKNVLPNLKEYHKPTFSWTHKIADGNMRNIVKANLYNFRAFEQEFGAVDLIHAHTNHPSGRIAMALAAIVKKPYCITEHMSPFPCIYTSDKQGKIKEPWLVPYTQSKVNISVSPAEADLMQKQGIKNIIVIPNFVDEDFFKPAKFISSSVFTFLTLTSAIPRKGIEILLKAIKLLNRKDELPQLVFRIGGIGDFSQYLSLVSELGISDKIVWLPEANREEMLSEYQHCDSFVLASFEESFGVVYAEAIACGKPIIATRCGGPESIVNEINGLLVDVNNPQALAEAISNMVENYNRYDSTAIREDFIKRFSKKAVVPQLIQLYKNIITSTP